MTVCCQQAITQTEPGSFIVLEDGHSYFIRNRGGSGGQVINFMKIKEGEVTAGCFTQDLIEIMINRINFQYENDRSASEHHRIAALNHLLRAANSYRAFTHERKALGKPLIGHNESEFADK